MTLLPPDAFMNRANNVILQCKNNLKPVVMAFSPYGPVLQGLSPYVLSELICFI